VFASEARVYFVLRNKPVLQLVAGRKPSPLRDKVRHLGDAWRYTHRQRVYNSGRLTAVRWVQAGLDNSRDSPGYIGRKLRVKCGGIHNFLHTMMTMLEGIEDTVLGMARDMRENTRAIRVCHDDLIDITGRALAREGKCLLNAISTYAAHVRIVALLTHEYARNGNTNIWQ
jgi:hypothetical protein